MLGETLGHLRASIKQSFGIPHFEQNIQYQGGSGALDGDDSMLLKEVEGLLEAKELTLTRQVDPRYSMEKQTAFLEALAACKFAEAKEILCSSGVAIDPNCTYRHRPVGRVAVTECPAEYRHPALTHAMMAGFGAVVPRLHFGEPEAAKLQAWLDKEDEVLEIVKLLIERGADVNAVGDETQDCESAGAPKVHGKTPLCAAVQRGSPSLVRVLLEAKADPNHRHQYDTTAWNPGSPHEVSPKDWLSELCNGSVSSRNDNDPRNRHSDEIKQMLHTASQK